METIVSEADRIRVLMVEDEFFIAEWVAESLSDLGFAVEIASNARDALRLLQSASVDVLFTDINLPGGIDGAALARQARQLLPELPVIYASARITMLEPKARVRGAAFVRKPYEPEMVGRLILEVMAPMTAAVLA
jgi:two-component system, response regulator PdtaR